MRANTLKQKLGEGKPAFGVMLTFPSAPVVELLGDMGFDWILLDNEHVGRAGAARQYARRSAGRGRRMRRLGWP
jgi:2-keto-3-deoxy-L-rhamnonate aldolase RhmA